MRSAKGSIRSNWFSELRGTVHNRKCRKLLAELGAIPYGERFAAMERALAHDDIDDS